MLTDFNPRSPHGERLQICVSGNSIFRDFNPRSPHGERPAPSRPARCTSSISIHALLTESDFSMVRTFSSPSYFNPRSPHGERLHLGLTSDTPDHFNPRSPHGERLSPGVDLGYPRPFQSTLSSRRATASQILNRLFHGDFNPRSPHGERPDSFNSLQESVGISIHALLTESDVYCGLPGPGRHRFQSTLSSRRATSC